MISQVDLLSSFSNMFDIKLPAGDAMDSEDVLKAMLGKSNSGRKVLVEQGAGTLAIVKEQWKYIEPNNGRALDTLTNTELGNSPQPQLYDLKNDIGEKNNLASEYPQKVAELAGLLKQIKDKDPNK